MKVWTVWYGITPVTARLGPLFTSKDEAQRFAERVTEEEDRKDNPYSDWVCELQSINVFDTIEECDEWFDDKLKG